MPDSSVIDLVRAKLPVLEKRIKHLARTIRANLPVKGEPWQSKAAYDRDPQEAIAKVVKACRTVAAALNGLPEATLSDRQVVGTVPHAINELRICFGFILECYGWQHGLPVPGSPLGFPGDAPPEIPEHHVRFIGTLGYLREILGRYESNRALTAFIAPPPKSAIRGKAKEMPEGTRYRRRVPAQEQELFFSCQTLAITLMPLEQRHR